MLTAKPVFNVEWGGKLWGPQWNITYWGPHQEYINYTYKSNDHNKNNTYWKYLLHFQNTLTDELLYNLSGLKDS